MNENNSPASRATMQQMDRLHSLLADVFLAELSRCRTAKECPEPSFLGQVIKWLKDNGIDTPERARGIDRLLGQLPDFEALEIGNVPAFPRPA